MNKHTAQNHEIASHGPRVVQAISCDPTLKWGDRVAINPDTARDLGPGHVRVGMLAMTINPADLLQLSGAYGVKPELPYVPGHEGVGVILETGPEVTALSRGQRVLLMAGGGCWRDERVVNQRQVVALDDALDPLQCAMLTANPATAWVLLKHVMELQPGDVVLLNAANSAVGQCVRQLAAQWGISTINVVRRASATQTTADARCHWLVDDGQAIDTLRQQIDALVGGQRIPLALDAIGGEATARLAQCVSDSGSVVVYGLLSGADSVVPAHDIVFRDVRVRGFWLARWFADPANKAHAKGLYPSLAALVHQGVIQMAVDATYPLERVAEALAHAASAERNGKILLTGKHWMAT